MGLWKKGQFAQAGQKWQTNYGASGPAMKSGVAAPSKDPTQAAIAAQAALLAGFQQSVTSGQWASNLQRSGQAGWQSGMNTFINNGLGTAATKGAPRVTAFGQQYGAAVMSQVNQLPQRGAPGTNQQRSTTFNQWQHSQKGKYKGAWRGTTG